MLLHRLSTVADFPTNSGGPAGAVIPAAVVIPDVNGVTPAVGLSACSWPFCMPLAFLHASAGFTTFACVPAFAGVPTLYCVGAPVVAFIPADTVACVLAVAAGPAVILALACCCRHCCSCATAVASVPSGIPAVAGVPLVPDVITVCWPPDYCWRPWRCWRSAVPAVAGVPVVVGVLAFASVLVDPIASLFKLVLVHFSVHTVQ
jgi:hypothetical protein